MSTETQAVPAEPARPAKPRRRWPWAVGLVLAFGAGAGVGQTGQGTTATTLASGSGPAPTTVTAPAPPPVSVTAAPETVVSTAAPVTVMVTTSAAPPVSSGPATSFGTGQYQVGVDIVAGHYKSAGPADGTSCYVEVARNDLGTLDSIISNDIVEGPKSVTVSRGQYVKNDGCETFTKTG